MIQFNISMDTRLISRESERCKKSTQSSKLRLTLQKAGAINGAINWSISNKSPILDNQFLKNLKILIVAFKIQLLASCRYKTFCVVKLFVWLKALPLGLRHFFHAS